MGREIKRVPLDFDLPLNKEWIGYINPYHKYEHTCLVCRGEIDIVDCPACGGDGVTWERPEHKALYEAWEPIEPPTGKGWQLWETVSAGSPISPVLPTREAFADYLINLGHSRSAVEKFIEKGFAPSAVFVGGRFIEGIDAFDVL